MTKVSIEDVLEGLKQAKVPAKEVGATLDYLKKVVQEEQAQKDAEKLPTQKNEYGVILFDADGVVAGKEFSAAVYQIPQGDDHGLVLGKISQAAREQVAAAKRKKYPINTMGEATSSIKRKFIKDKNVNLKTKNPVRVLISDNKLV
jgi:hypothetical protein